MNNIEQWRIYPALWHFFKGRERGGLGFICLWVSMTQMKSEEITLCSGSVDGGSICLWVSMTPMNSEEITLLWQCFTRGGPSAFESQWHQWTVKRLLCSITVLTGGSICLWVSMTPMNSEEITLCSGSVNWGVHLPLSFSDTNEQWRDYSSITVLTGGHLPLNLNDTNEQWRDHSVLWQCFYWGVHLPLSLNDTNEQWRDYSFL